MPLQSERAIQRCELALKWLRGEIDTTEWAGQADVPREKAVSGLATTLQVAYRIGMLAVVDRELVKRISEDQ